jgi:hypothetical protein
VALYHTPGEPLVREIPTVTSESRNNLSIEISVGDGGSTDGIAEALVEAISVIIRDEDGDIIHSRSRQAMDLREG